MSKARDIVDAPTNHATLAELKARRADALERCKGHDPRTAQWRGQAEGEVRALTQSIALFEEMDSRLRGFIESLYDLAIPEHDECGNPIITPAAAMREKVRLDLEALLQEFEG